MSEKNTTSIFKEVFDKIKTKSNTSLKNKEAMLSCLLSKNGLIGLTSFILLFFIAKCIFNSYDQIQVLQNALNNLATAWIALLIPIAIFLFESVDRKGQSFGWDMHVLMTKILDAESLFWATLKIFLPTLLFSIAFFELKTEKDSDPLSIIDYIIITLILWLSILGNYQYFKSLKNSYLWLRDSSPEDKNSLRNLKRLEYLQSLSSIEEQAKVWSLTWAVKFDEPTLEEQFFEVYVNQLEVYKNPRTTEEFRKLFEAFAHNLTQRTTNKSDIQDLIDGIKEVLRNQKDSNESPNQFQSSLSNTVIRHHWIINKFMPVVFNAFFIFNENKQHASNSNMSDNEVRSIYQLEESLKKFIKSLSELSFDQPIMFSAIFFKSMKEAIDNQIQETPNDNGNNRNDDPTSQDFILKGRINALVQIVAPVIFNRSLKSQDHFIWNNFPKEWKVTTENIVNNSFVAKCWYEVWYYKAFEVVTNAAFITREQNLEKEVRGVLTKLFIVDSRFNPKVDPDWITLTRLFYADVLHDMPDRLIKTPPILSAPVMYSDDEESNIKNNAFELAKLLFGCAWVPSIINNLDSLNISPTSDLTQEELNTKNNYETLLNEYKLYCTGENGELPHE